MAGYGLSVDAAGETVDVASDGADAGAAEAAAAVDGAGFAAVLLYDGVCGLCNRVVRFALRHDRHARLRFAALDSAFARGALASCGLDPAYCDSLVLVQAAGRAGFPAVDQAGRPDAHPSADTGAARIHLGGRAVIRLLKLLGGGWAALAALLDLLPRPALDWGYRAVAHRRYRLFGRYDSCPAPPPKWRGRFIA